MLESIVLGMVMDAPLTGYDIKKSIEAGIGTFYKASYGNLYPLLKRLTEKELLTVQDEPKGNRNKKYYKVTDNGKTAFFEWLEAPIDFANSTEQKLAKIFFFDRLPEDTRMERIEEYEQDCNRTLRKLRAMLNKYKKMNVHYYELSTLYYGISIVQTTAMWCKSIKNKGELDDFVSER